MTRLAAALLAGLAATPAAAHPHVFVDATLTLRFDAEGRLVALATSWTYDEFYTLYAIEALEMDPEGDGALSPEELAEMARIHTSAASDQEEFPSQLWLKAAGEHVPLQLPSGAAASLAADRLTVTFERLLEVPADPAVGLSARIYDPSYFIAYTIVADPVAEALPGGCTVRLIPFAPDALQQQTLSELSLLSMEETPYDPQIGAMLSDEVRVTCD